MATNKILLVSEKEIKDNSTIEDNVEPKLLNLIISDLQKNDLKKLITNDVYTDLINACIAFKDFGTPLTEFQNELKDEYIKPWLIAATVVDFIVLNNYKITNKSVLKLDDTQAKGIDSGELEYILGYYKIKASTAKSNLLEFLKTDGDSTCSDGSDTSTNADLGGLYLVNSYKIGYTGRNRYL